MLDQHFIVQTIIRKFIDVLSGFGVLYVLFVGSASRNVFRHWNVAKIDYIHAIAAKIVFMMSFHQTTSVVDKNDQSF